MDCLIYADKMRELFRHYYAVTNIRIAFLDLNFKDILSYPEQRSPICTYIRKRPDADACCRL